MNQICVLLELCSDIYLFHGESCPVFHVLLYNLQVYITGCSIFIFVLFLFNFTLRAVFAMKMHTSRNVFDIFSFIYYLSAIY